MKRTAMAATAAAVLLLLAGCTSTTTTETVTVTSGASGTYSDGDTTVVVEPSETPATPVEVTATTPPEAKAADVLVNIQLTVAGYDVVVNADQIKSAANYTCDQLAAGVDEKSIVALTGDIPVRANEALVQMSADYYCGVR
jgi:ABC-type glycerol-3-phosphate transport system substrate-binding protein